MTRRWQGLIGLWLIGWTLTSCSQRPLEVTLQEGRELEEQGEYVAAMKYYQYLPDPWLREVCQHNLEYLYGDILDGMLAREQDADTAKTYYDLGEAYYDKARSLPDKKKVAPNHGFDTQSYFAERQAFFESHSLTALQEATQRRPDYREALKLAGLVYEEMEQPEEAIAVYQSLAETYSDSAEVCYRLGILLYNQGHTWEGLEYAERAAMLAPENPNPHFALGLLYAREGQPDYAISEFHQTLCYTPSYQAAYQKLAQVYLRQNNLIDAERVLRLGVEQNPDALQLGLFYNSLRSVLDAKEVEMAEEVYQQLSATTEAKSVADQEDEEASEISPRLQRRQLQLQLNIVKRQRSYILPCTDDAEDHPYFTRKIALLEEQIAQLDQEIRALQ